MNLMSGTCVLPLCSMKSTGTTKSWIGHRPKARNVAKVVFSSSKHADKPEYVEDILPALKERCMGCTSASSTDGTSSSESSSTASMRTGSAALSGTSSSAMSAGLPNHTVSNLTLSAKCEYSSSSDDSSAVSSRESMSVSASESSTGVQEKTGDCSEMISQSADSDTSSVVSLSESISTTTSESAAAASVKESKFPTMGNDSPAHETRAVVGTINHAGLKVGENRNAVVDSWLNESVVAARANGDGGFVPSVAMGKRFTKQF